MINFKKFAVIPELVGKEEFKFLVVEYDLESGGYNLHYHQKIESKSIKMDWFEEFDAIKSFANLEFGIEFENWIDY